MSKRMTFQYSSSTNCGELQWDWKYEHEYFGMVLLYNNNLSLKTLFKIYYSYIINNKEYKRYLREYNFIRMHVSQGCLK